MRVQCSTCLELLTPDDDLTCTPCGHVFHLACVVQWFETKKNCPQCRHSANERTLRKIYLAETGGESTKDPNDLQNQLDNAQFQLRLKEAEKSKVLDRNKDVEDVLRQQKDEIKKIEHDKRKYKEQAEGMRTQNRVLQEERYKYEDALKETQEVKGKLEKYKAVEIAVKGLEADLNTFLHERGAFDKKTKDISTLVIVLKKKLAEVKKERGLYEGRLREEAGKHEIAKRKFKDLEVQLAEAQCNNKLLEKDLWRSQEDVRILKERQQTERLSPVSCSADDTQPLVIDALVSPLKTASPPPTQPSSGYRLPSYKLVGATKRSLSTESDDERSPLMPVLNHSSKRLATEKSVSRPSHLWYDGLGGRAKNDLFPVPKSQISLSSQSLKSQTSTKIRLKTKPGISGVNSKQTKTIDKFFGSFDTP